MESPTAATNAGLGSVRTPPPVSSACPTCGKPLKRAQTVCSARCRAALWRRRRQDRDREVRVLLDAALKLLGER